MSLTKLQLEVLEYNARTNVVEVIRNGETFHIDEDTKNSLAYKKALMDKELEKFLEKEGFNNEVITLKMFDIEINLPLLADTHEKFDTMIMSILTDDILDEPEIKKQKTLKDHLNEYAKFLEYKSYVLSMWSEMSYRERKDVLISNLRVWVYNVFMSAFEVDIDRMSIRFTDVEVEIEHLCETLQKTLTC